MAMIDCKECGWKISDKAKACPQCGVTLPVTCTECGKEFSGDGKACPYCGCPRKDSSKIEFPIGYLIFMFSFLVYIAYSIIRLIF